MRILGIALRENIAVIRLADVGELVCNDDCWIVIGQPDITLDDSMKCYSEAVELIAFCRKYISDAKLTVRKLEEA